MSDSLRHKEYDYPAVSVQFVDGGTVCLPHFGAVTSTRLGETGRRTASR